MRINADCEIRVILHSKNVSEVYAVYNNKFIRRLYVGVNYATAINKFKEELLKGGN